MSTNPEQVALKASSARLYEKLNAEGVNLTGVGFGLNGHGTAEPLAIRVYCLRKADQKRVPKEFEGHEVVCVVTGPIRPL